MTGDSLDVAVHVAAVASPRRGATSVFVGIVRNHDPSVTGTVRALEYVAHPTAGEALRRIVEGEAATGDIAVAASHRVGLLTVGDAALVVAVGTPHRAESFAACERIVELIKRDVPIWKREILADGTAHWVGVS